MNEVSKIVEELLGSASLVRLTLSGPCRRAEENYRKVVARPVLLRGERTLQFEYHYPHKVTHRNLPPREAEAHVVALLTETFKQGHFLTEDTDIQVFISSKGQPRIVRRPAARKTADLRHNRSKNYLLAENRPCDFLHRLGVMTAEGRVLAAKHNKFRQINRYLEMVEDVADHLPAEGPLKVVDFGCGKSYLTFALYYYLRRLRQREVRIVGLDLKQDVVAHCNAVAEALRYDGLDFVVGEIRGYDGLEKADMVVSLHACDTATDDALAKAVQWGAKVILAVPCCQHELFPQIKNETLQPMLQHGILKERLVALITDSLRAKALEAAGYSVQMLEFIETEHTPKNILLRAVKRDSSPNRAQRLQEYRALRDFWRVRPHLEEALGDSLKP